jgi:hypothetical protein
MGLAMLVVSGWIIINDLTSLAYTFVEAVSGDPVTVLPPIAVAIGLTFAQVAATAGVGESYFSLVAITCMLGVWGGPLALGWYFISRTPVRLPRRRPLPPLRLPRVRGQ